MKIQKFSQLGKRNNNEDSLGLSAGLLTVCDGMGGHNYGERASAFVKEAMLQAFPEPRPIGKMDIQQQLNTVQSDLNKLLDKEPELEKMGTTFTGVFITPDVWYAAHIGDSRIYLFRPSEQKLWHTWDHSLVGELMRTKEITIEAGRFHPMSNRIAKAIIAQQGGKPSSASIVKIDELKKGDILLLCSDGVVEGWGDWELVKLFSDEKLSFEQKCDKLKRQCNEKSKDNNTAVVVEIDEGDAFSYGNDEELSWTTFAEVKADYDKFVKDNEEVEDTQVKTTTQPKAPLSREADSRSDSTQSMPSRHSTAKTNKLWFLLILVILLAAAVAALILMPKGETPSDDNTTEEVSDTITKDTAKQEQINVLGGEGEGSDDERQDEINKDDDSKDDSDEDLEEIDKDGNGGIDSNVNNRNDSDEDSEDSSDEDSDDESNDHTGKNPEGKVVTNKIQS